MPGHKSLGFDHKKIPHLGIHYSEGGWTTHDVNQRFHGHAYVVEPPKMSAEEFNALVNSVIRGCGKGRCIVLFRPSKKGVKEMGDSYSGTSLLGHPTKVGEFLLMHENDFKGDESHRQRAIERMRKAQREGHLDEHIGDVPPEARGKKKEIMRLLKEYVEG